MCDICQNWADPGDPKYSRLRLRGDLPAVANHHPNCPHYNDSLMNVWRVSLGGISCYVDNEQDAKSVAIDEASDDALTITPEKMHREIFENLQEFDGF